MGFLRLFTPSLRVGCVSDIEFAKLEKNGIRALMLDLDNTLTPWRGYDIYPGVREWIEKAKGAGFKLCIVSNTRTPKRLQQIASDLGLPFAKKALKPRSAGFREGLRIMECDFSEAAVVGDQIFTDVWGGNRLGMFTILVDRISPREFFGTKISRFFERILLRFTGEKDKDSVCDCSGEQSLK